MCRIFHTYFMCGHRCELTADPAFLLRDLAANPATLAYLLPNLHAADPAFLLPNLYTADPAFLLPSLYTADPAFLLGNLPAACHQINVWQGTSRQDPDPWSTMGGHPKAFRVPIVAYATCGQFKPANIVSLVQHMQSLQRHPNDTETLVDQKAAVIVPEMCSACKNNRAASPLSAYASLPQYESMCRSVFYNNAIEMALKGETETVAPANKDFSMIDGQKDPPRHPRFSAYYQWTGSSDGCPCLTPVAMRNPLQMTPRLNWKMQEHMQWLYAMIEKTKDYAPWGNLSDVPRSDLKQFQEHEAELLWIWEVSRRVRENMNSSGLLEIT